MRDIVDGYMYDTHKAAMVWEREGTERHDYPYNADAEIRTTVRRLYRTPNGRWFQHVQIKSDWWKYSIWTRALKKQRTQGMVKETVEPLTVDEVQKLALEYEIDFKKHGIPEPENA